MKVFCSEAAELEFLMAHPFAGGAPEGEGEGEGGQAGAAGDQHQAGEGEGSGEGKREPGDTGGKPPTEGAWIPKHRFDEVNRSYQDYKSFGRPEDVKKRLDRLAELEQLPANRLNDKEKSEIRKELLNVFPELQVLSNTVQIQRQAYTERGAVKNNEFLKEIGLEATDATNNYMQELLSGIIAADPKLLRRFYSMDDTVFTEAFAVAKKTFWPNVKRVVPGAGVESKKLPNRMPPGKQAAAGQGDKSKKPEALDRLGERDLLDQASEQAFAMLEGSREE